MMRRRANVKNVVAPTNSAPHLAAAIAANACSKSSPRTSATTRSRRSAVAAMRTSDNCCANPGSAGASSAMRVARGTVSFSSSSFLAASVPSAAMRTPVTLPPGRPRLATRPAATGSRFPYTTIGIVVVAALAARAAAVPTVTIASTRDSTSSRASRGSAATSPPAKRCSSTRFTPTVYPRSAIARGMPPANRSSETAAVGRRMPSR